MGFPRSNAIDKAAEFKRDVSAWVADLGRKRYVQLLVPTTKRKRYPVIGKRGKPIQDRRRRNKDGTKRAPPPSNADVLGYFIETRDYLKVNTFARGWMVEKTLAQFESRFATSAALPSGEALGMAVGGAWKQLVVMRFENSGYDLRPRPLSWEWAQTKERLHLHQGIGRASDQLLSALRAATIVVSYT